MVVSEQSGEQSESGEYIPEHAPHWQAEPFIPVPPAELKNFLTQSLASEDARHAFSRGCEKILYKTREAALTLHEKIDEAYALLDPDRDTSLVIEHTDQEQREAAEQLSLWMREAFERANYEEIPRSTLEEACKVSSLWGVPIHVDLNIFRHLNVYARGDVVGKRELRALRNLYRGELVDVEIYRRLVVLFQVLPEMKIEGEGQADRYYLRMFKNIPKADVDMLLPGTKIRFGWFDHTKILIPSLGGLGVSLWKIVRIVLLVAVITTSKLLVLIGLVGATIGYIARSVTSYFNRKKHYELNLTRSLYFQKLDSNAGVIYRVLEEAQQQEYREAVLALYALISSPNPLSINEVVSVGKTKIREALGVEIVFEAMDAIEILAAIELIEIRGESIHLVQRY